MGRGGGGETREFVFTQIKRLYWGTWWWSNLMNRSSCSNCSCEGNHTGEKVAAIPASVALSLRDRLLGSGLQAPASKMKGERLGISAGLALPGTCWYRTRACRSARRRCRPDPQAAISGARLYPSIHALRAAVESLHKSTSRSWNSSGKESTATTTAVGSEAVEP